MVSPRGCQGAWYPLCCVQRAVEPRGKAAAEVLLLSRAWTHVPKGPLRPFVANAGVATCFHIALAFRSTASSLSNAQPFFLFHPMGSGAGRSEVSSGLLPGRRLLELSSGGCGIGLLSPAGWQQSVPAGGSPPVSWASGTRVRSGGTRPTVPYFVLCCVARRRGSPPRRWRRATASGASSRIVSSW